MFHVCAAVVCSAGKHHNMSTPTHTFTDRVHTLAGKDRLSLAAAQHLALLGVDDCHGSSGGRKERSREGGREGGRKPLPLILVEKGTHLRTSTDVSSVHICKDTVGKKTTLRVPY